MYVYPVYEEPMSSTAERHRREVTDTGDGFTYVILRATEEALEHCIDEDVGGILVPDSYLHFILLHYVNPQVVHIVIVS